MIGKLTSEEIESLLQQQFIGHLGCQDKDTVYVVPVSYARLVMLMTRLYLLATVSKGKKWQ